MKNRERAVCVILALLCTIGIVRANGYSDMYARCTFMSKEGIELNYRLLTPEIQAGASNPKYPLIVFLHGSGERGDDNSSQLSNGGRFFASELNRHEYPAYVIFPQCPEHSFWSYKKAPNPSKGPKGLKVEKQELPIMVAVMDLIKEFEQKPDIDMTRIYLVGISMGGLAVYDLACRHPEVFAAAVPICGAVDPSRLERVKEIPFLIFHGKKDDVIPVIASEIAYETLKGEGADVEYIEFPNEGHDCWDSAFAYPGLMDWIFSHHKAVFPSPTNVLASSSDY